MKRDKAWLKEKVSDIFWRVEIDSNFNVQNANIMFDDISNLIDQLDEPQKSVIPQFVAGYIEKWEHEGLTMYEWFSFDNNDGDEDVNKWLYNNNIEENRRREYLLVDAIRYGYTVEKEQLYYIHDDITGRYLGYNSEKTKLDWYHYTTEKKMFTEAEIKAIDERYWAFAEEVTE